MAEHIIPCGDPTCGECNQTACSEAFFGRPVTPPAPGDGGTCPCCQQPMPVAVRATEAVAAEAIGGQRSMNDTRALLEEAIRGQVRADTGRSWVYACVRDFSDDQVVYEYDEHIYQRSYTLSAAGTTGTVSLGAPVEVVAQVWYVPATDGADQGDPGGDPAMAGEAFAAGDHPRAPSGSDTGGQFAGGGGGAKKTGAAAKAKAKPAATKTVASGTLVFDGTTGTGYAKPDQRVQQLQTALTRLGVAKLTTDGKYGPKTTAAVKAIQQRLGVTADGKVTPQLLTRIVGLKSLPAAAKAGGVDQVDGRATESERIYGRILEAKGINAAGGRIFRVRIIAYGDSKNRRRYPAAVMQEAMTLYEGAKAYDHHRSLDEIGSGALHGLIGSYRGVEALDDGLYGDLHLLPSAALAAEALDASLAAQDAGLPPLVGISHDVLAHFQPADGGRVQEAIEIVDVQSADVVATPAAGGRAVRAVAGGTTDPDGDQPPGQRTEETDVSVTTADVLAALSTATPDQLAAHGLTRAGTPTTEAVATAATEQRTIETAQPKTSWLAKAMIRQKIEDADLPVATLEAVTTALPEQIVESDVDAQIAALKAAVGVAERAGLVPTVTTQVTQEARDKKIAALDAFFTPNTPGGYRSFKEAFVDITGRRPRAFDEDFSRTILRESFGAGFDSGARATESLDSTSWAQVLGDSVARRMVAEYALPALSEWRRVVSSIFPVTDFRTQRITRIGGYGTLPVVNQGAPYQPLTSPGDEEATYTIIKRGGTDDLTFEMIANDDVRAIAGLPRLMGRAAAITLYRFVFDLFTANAAVTYDSVALFDAAHANTTTGALTQSNLSAARSAMRNQARYGDSNDLLSLVPQILLVPNELEEIAFQLTTSAVAIPATPAGPSDAPNLHSRMQPPIVVDYWTDANDWFALADPNMCPTIEVGFYQGRQEPELFTQADQAVGSMFNADKMTFKIRHMYGSTVLDHRGMYRSTN